MIGGKKKKRDVQRKTARTSGLFFLISGLFLLGMGIFLYPFVVNGINNAYDQYRIKGYQSEMQQANQQQLTEKRKQLQEKNQERKEHSVPGMVIEEDVFETAIQGVQDPGRDYFDQHLLGLVYIPAIQVSLPIFDETNESLLARGATLLQGSSYPVGGSGTHAVLTGHSGLPDKKLFTDLSKLQIGDVIFVDVFGEQLAYEIDRFQTVLPTDVQALDIQPEADLLTLVTCTPYMVNSHRLLVTSHRIAYPAEKIQDSAGKIQRHHYLQLIMIVVGSLTVIALVIWRMWHRWQQLHAQNRYYQIHFFAYQDHQPIAQVRYAVLTAKGHYATNKLGEPFIATSTLTGEVLFKDLPAGSYQIVEEGKRTKKLLQAQVKHYRCENMRLQAIKGKIKRRKVTGINYWELSGGI